MLKKYLIVGLGNPGLEYRKTRHNIGFRVIDYLCSELKVSLRPGQLAFFAQANYKGRKLTLIEPTTYMNRSGEAVFYWLKKESLTLESLIVIVDDIHIPLGKIKLKKKGGDGGHNGLGNIEKCSRSTNYSRLRFGVGNNFDFGKQGKYVLEDFNPQEEPIVEEGIKQAAQIILSCCWTGIDHTLSSGLASKSF